MSKLKTAEEVAVELNLKRLPASGAIHPREIRDAFIRDRHAIHTLLRESITGMRGNESDGYYGQALDDILTIIDEVFSNKTESNVSHK